ncbi:hypothetical protein O3G_MSEX006255 [Manduca sexta]|uniref:Uncharacterized protein n=1 Tax=Manduca sexta TaxID=7130 RepID=A0A921Z2K4_MANSE|nr:hypothetical protein O3G_MSEX006255 [Manduca sexta]
MRLTVFFIAVLCLFQYGYTYCCFRTQPSTACAVAETPCMSSCAMSNGCCGGCCGGCGGCGRSNCGCGAACGCCRERSNVCSTCKPTTSPVCSCLSECNCKSTIYFPEVEYPATIIEMTPNYYGACWSY